jgi:hypothetical protein
VAVAAFFEHQGALLALISAAEAAGVTVEEITVRITGKMTAAAGSPGTGPG